MLQGRYTDGKKALRWFRGDNYPIQQVTEKY